MQLKSDSFRPYDFLHPRLAFARMAPKQQRVALSDNLNPHLAWWGQPSETKSFAILVYDVDVPTVGTHVNQEHKSVPLLLPRADFFHWVLVDLPPTLAQIHEGAHSRGVTARGKKPGPSPDGGVHGINDYTGWFAGDKDMSGDYGGYDGPCPPWNDERMHGYRFTVYALDVPTLGLSGSFGGAQAREAMRGHVLDEATLIGLYTLNPEVARPYARALEEFLK